MKEITRTIDSVIGWFKNKDYNLLFGVLAHDYDYISFQPTDRVMRGFEHFEKNIELSKRPEFQHAQHEVKI